MVDMGWLRDRFGQFGSAPRDLAERLTGRGLFRVARESAALSDRQTVQKWLRELRPEKRNEQVLVHRPWGTVAAVADGHHPVGVVLSDGEKSWYASAPGATKDQKLTPEQVEHIMLDALTAPSRPDWPEWRYLV
jgi:hypothetical protein